MRKCRLLFIVLAILISLPCIANEKVIELKGSWSKTKKDSIPEIPINAWIRNESKELLLQFSENLGSVQVNITNTAGEVFYSQTVDSGSIPSLIIAMDEWSYSGCILSITDSENLVYGQIIY